MLPAGLRMKVDASLGDIVGHLLLWIVLMIVTLGLAGFVFPYMLNRFVLSKVEIVDNTGARVGRLQCMVDLGDAVGHCLLWILLSIVTLGLAYFVFLYYMVIKCLNKTVIVTD